MLLSGHSTPRDVRRLSKAALDMLVFVRLLQQSGLSCLIPVAFGTHAPINDSSVMFALLA